ncbi:MAG: T9SS type A sorting domain-containing protein [Flavobacteriales bacterium]|nr:T9SS type A sorting domain-containing protein [Flavobacteriales bacterium]
MKHIYLLAIIVATAFGASAQSVEPVETWEENILVPDGESEGVYSMYMTNVGSSDVNLRVSAHVVSIVFGAEYRFCWGPSCFLWTTEDYTSPDQDYWIVNIAPGAVDTTFYTDYRHNDNDGISTIEYCWFDVNNTSDESCYTLNWHYGVPFGVDDVQKVELSAMSPNPVTGTSSFTYQINGNPVNVNIVFHNLVGEKVQEVQAQGPNGVVFVNADDFETGIYFYSIVADGKVLSTQKMVVSH